MGKGLLSESYPSLLGYTVYVKVLIHACPMIFFNACVLVLVQTSKKYVLLKDNIVLFLTREIWLIGWSFFFNGWLIKLVSYSQFFVS